MEHYPEPWRFISVIGVLRNIPYPLDNVNSHWKCSCFPASLQFFWNLLTKFIVKFPDLKHLNSWTAQKISALLDMSDMLSRLTSSRHKCLYVETAI